MPPQERSTRAEGVILRHSDLGEADRLLTIFTRELGKVRVLAKGVRKARSRKAGHVEPFTQAQLQLAHGRDLLILTQAESVAGFAALREDLVLLGYASYVIELLDRSTYEEESNRALYDLLVRTLTRLNRGDDPNLATRYYELRLLDFAGFRPQLFNCAQCESEIQPEDQFFSASRGGVLCPRCGGREPETRPISLHALKYLRHFQRSSYREAGRAAITTAQYQEMENLMQYYLTYTLERGLNSPAFLRRVRRENGKIS
ncbi:MAG TPA: DNA repair protein RecO [Chloroflexi bacterium]|nr:DNA repair protein RecO [Chloroflexota bacterium]